MVIFLRFLYHCLISLVFNLNVCYLSVITNSNLLILMSWYVGHIKSTLHILTFILLSTYVFSFNIVILNDIPLDNIGYSLHPYWFFISEKYEVTNPYSLTLLYKISYWSVEKCITYRPYSFWVSHLMLWNVVSYSISTKHILKILLCLTILNNVLRFNIGILNGIPLGDNKYPLHPNDPLECKWIKVRN